jgi:hypothetical protein
MHHITQVGVTLYVKGVLIDYGKVDAAGYTGFAVLSIYGTKRVLLK